MRLAGKYLDVPILIYMLPINVIKDNTLNNTVLSWLISHHELLTISGNNILAQSSGAFIMHIIHSRRSLLFSLCLFKISMA